MNLNSKNFLIKTALFLERMGILSPRRISQWKYFLRFGKRADLQNPKNLNEKILWLLHCTDTSKWTELSDKYRVRKYVEDCGLGHLLVKLYGVYDSVDAVDFDQLPQSFVLKTNNGCGTVILVDDKERLDWESVKSTLNKWLKIPFGVMSAEPHYRRIKPCIIAEEYLKEDSSVSTSLIDYKVWCFDGKPAYVFTACNRNTESNEVDFGLYDVDWKSRKELLKVNAKTKNKIMIPKPRHLDEMLEAAKILSQGFPVLRVDLYHVNGKVYFGELTFTSHGGLMPNYTQECLDMMGNKVTLPTL